MKPMTVSELIEELKKFDGEQIVLMRDGCEESLNYVVRVNVKNEYDSPYTKGCSPFEDGINEAVVIFSDIWD